MTALRSKGVQISLTPQLSSGAKGAVMSSGGWNTVQSYGGKAHDRGDIEETRQIVEKMAKYDRQYTCQGQGKDGKKWDEGP
jgi:hypothetical protein